MKKEFTMTVIAGLLGLLISLSAFSGEKDFGYASCTYQSYEFKTDCHGEGQERICLPTTLKSQELTTKVSQCVVAEGDDELACEGASEYMVHEVNQSVEATFENKSVRSQVSLYGDGQLSFGFRRETGSLGSVSSENMGTPTSDNPISGMLYAYDENTGVGESMLCFLGLGEPPSSEKMLARSLNPVDAAASIGHFELKSGKMRFVKKRK